MDALPDYSIGFTVAEVEAILTTNKAELTKMLASYSDSGSQAVRRRLDEVNLTISACQRALQKLCPARYGRSSRVGYSSVSEGFHQA